MAKPEDAIEVLSKSTQLLSILELAKEFYTAEQRQEVLAQMASRKRTHERLLSELQDAGLTQSQMQQRRTALEVAAQDLATLHKDNPLLSRIYHAKQSLTES